MSCCTERKLKEGTLAGARLTPVPIPSQMSRPKPTASPSFPSTAGRTIRSAVPATAPSPLVLVTDGEQRASLAVVRSLGRAGYRVVVCSTHGRSLAGASRYALREYAVPDVLAEPESWAVTVGSSVLGWASDCCCR